MERGGGPGGRQNDIEEKKQSSGARKPDRGMGGVDGEVAESLLMMDSCCEAPAIPASAGIPDPHSAPKLWESHHTGSWDQGPTPALFWDSCLLLLPVAFLQQPLPSHLVLLVS